VNFLNVSDKKRNKNSSDENGERFQKVLGCSRLVSHLVQASFLSGQGGLGRSDYLSVIH